MPAQGWYMMPVFSSTRAGSRDQFGMPRSRILLMAESAEDLAACATLLRSSGCEVQECSGYLELLLFLEHGNFQLVMIFERKASENKWLELVKRIAEIDRGIPVMTLSQGRDAVGPISKLRPSGTFN